MAVSGAEGASETLKKGRVWPYNFIHCRTDDGKVFHTLYVLLEHSRVCSEIKVHRTQNSADVMDTLTDLFMLYRPLAFNRSKLPIESTNGSSPMGDSPEFVAKAKREWITAVGAKLAYLEPGKPWEIGNCESSNGRMRDKLLNGETFYSLHEAQLLIGEWKKHNKLTHSALGYKPPGPKPSHRWLRAQ